MHEPCASREDALNTGSSVAGFEGRCWVDCDRAWHRCGNLWAVGTCGKPYGHRGGFDWRMSMEEGKGRVRRRGEVNSKGDEGVTDGPGTQFGTVNGSRGTAGNQHPGHSAEATGRRCWGDKTRGNTRVGPGGKEYART
jgi:hypothetical protein